MTQHTHNDKCVLLSEVHKFIEEETGYRYNEKWIYQQKELRGVFRGEKRNMCINKDVLVHYIEQRQMVSSDKLKIYLNLAKEKRIPFTKIARHSAISYIRIWQYANNQRTLTQGIYQSIANAIEELLNTESEGANEDE